MYNTAAWILNHGCTMTTHLKWVCLHIEDIAVADNHSTGVREQSGYLDSRFQNNAFDVSFHHADNVIKYIGVGSG